MPISARSLLTLLPALASDCPYPCWFADTRSRSCEISPEATRRAAHYQGRRLAEYAAKLTA